MTLGSARRRAVRKLPLVGGSGGVEFWRVERSLSPFQTAGFRGLRGGAPGRAFHGPDLPLRHPRLSGRAGRLPLRALPERAAVAGGRQFRHRRGRPVAFLLCPDRRRKPLGYEAHATSA